MKINKKYKLMLVIIIILGILRVYYSYKEYKYNEEYKKLNIVTSDRNIEELIKKYDFNFKFAINKDLKIPENNLCINVDECIKIADKNLKILLKEYYSNNLDENAEEIIEKANNINFGNIDVITLKVDKIDEVELKNNSKLNEYQKKKLVKIYNIFKEIIPYEWRKDLKKIEIFSKKGQGAYTKSDENMKDIILGINVLERKENMYGIQALYIHEFAHMFSINSKEFDINYCKNPYSADIKCANLNSYIMKFYILFWEHLPEEWQNNEDKDIKLYERFYKLNKENFVNSYALSNVYEDFAETFVEYIFNISDNLDIEGGNKILFFYQFPELILLRTQILDNILKNKFYWSKKLIN